MPFLLLALFYRAKLATFFEFAKFLIYELVFFNCCRLVDLLGFA